MWGAPLLPTFFYAPPPALTPVEANDARQASTIKFPFCREITFGKVIFGRFPSFLKVTLYISGLIATK